MSDAAALLLEAQVPRYPTPYTLHPKPGEPPLPAHGHARRAAVPSGDIVPFLPVPMMLESCCASRTAAGCRRAPLNHSREPTDVQGGLLYHLVVSISSASSPASCDFGIIDPVVRGIRRGCRV